MMLTLIFFLIYGNSFEDFLNKKQSITYKIKFLNQTRCRCTEKEGLFFWQKGKNGTCCSFIYQAPSNHRSLMKREGKKTLHFVIPKDSRNKTSQTNISNSPLHAFFEKNIKIENDEWFVKKFEDLGKNRFKLTIHHFSDSKCQKEHAKIYIRKHENNWIFERWEIVKSDGKTIIQFLSQINIDEG